METIKKFYNIFWKEKSCRNLFLLSRHELLDSIKIGTNENSISYTTKNIIISNSVGIESKKEIIKFRTENQFIELQSLFASHNQEGFLKRYILANHIFYCGRCSPMKNGAEESITSPKTN